MSDVKEKTTEYAIICTLSVKIYTVVRTDKKLQCIPCLSLRCFDYDKFAAVASRRNWSLTTMSLPTQLISSGSTQHPHTYTPIQQGPSLATMERPFSAHSVSVPSATQLPLQGQTQSLEAPRSAPSSRALAMATHPLPYSPRYLFLASPPLSPTFLTSFRVLPSREMPAPPLCSRLSINLHNTESWFASLCSAPSVTDSCICGYSRL